METLTNIALQYWPVVASFLFTMVAVQSIKKPFSRIQGDIWVFSKQRMAIRLAAFVIGYVLTYAALIAFTENPQKVINYTAFFVGVGNPMAYWLLMLYIRVNKPDLYAKIHLAQSK